MKVYGCEVQRADERIPGMEKVSDHGTIGPRKKFNSQKILPKEE